MKSGGWVKLLNEHIPSTLIAVGHYQLRRLALLQVQPELTRDRRSAGPARRHSIQRSDSLNCLEIVVTCATPAHRFDGCNSGKI